MAQIERSGALKAMNEHAFPPPPAGHVTLAVSMIFGGSFYHAGTTIPLDQLAGIQASHDANVAEQIAEGQFQARQNDLADQAAKEFTEEQMVSNDHVVSPAINGEHGACT